MISAGLVDRLASGRSGEPWRIVITGSSGWVGRNAIDLLHEALGVEEFKDRVHLFGSVPRELDTGTTKVKQRPLSDISGLDSRPTLVLHLAFLTKDRAEVMGEAAYIAANEAIRHQLIDNLDPIGAERLFVASSGAATQADNPAATPAMRLYGALKREDEDRFSAWAQERDKRAIISRIFSLTGPHMNKPESYALAAFILQALARQDVAVNATRPVFRSYVPVSEMLALALSLMLEHDKGVACFETGGEPLEMGAIAGEVARQFGVRVARPIFDPTAEPDLYIGDDEPYRVLLSAQQMTPGSFAGQVAETAAYLAGLPNGDGQLPLHPGAQPSKLLT